MFFVEKKAANGQHHQDIGRYRPMSFATFFSADIATMWADIGRYRPISADIVLMLSIFCFSKKGGPRTTSPALVTYFLYISEKMYALPGISGGARTTSPRYRADVVRRLLNQRCVLCTVHTLWR
jgi:hypothetical protein